MATYSQEAVQQTNALAQQRQLEQQRQQAERLLTESSARQQTGLAGLQQRQIAKNILPSINQQIAGLDYQQQQIRQEQNLTPQQRAIRDLQAMPSPTGQIKDEYGGTIITWSPDVLAIANAVGIDPGKAFIMRNDLKISGDRLTYQGLDLGPASEVQRYAQDIETRRQQTSEGTYIGTPDIRSIAGQTGLSATEVLNKINSGAITQTETGFIYRAPDGSVVTSSKTFMQPITAPRYSSSINTGMVEEINPLTNRPYGVLYASPTQAELYKKDIADMGKIKGSFYWASEQGKRLAEKYQDYMFKQGDQSAYYQSEGFKNLAGLVPYAPYVSPVGPGLMLLGGSEYLGTPAGQRERTEIKTKIQNLNNPFISGEKVSSTLSYSPQIAEIGLGGFGVFGQAFSRVQNLRITNALKKPEIYFTGTIADDTARISAKSNILGRDFRSFSTQKLGETGSRGAELSFFETKPGVYQGTLSRTMSLNQPLMTAKQVRGGWLGRPLLDSAYLEVKTPIQNTQTFFGRGFNRPLIEGSFSSAKLKNLGMIDYFGESASKKLGMARVSSSSALPSAVDKGSFIAVSKAAPKDENLFLIAASSTPKIRIYKSGEMSYIMDKPNIKGAVRFLDTGKDLSEAGKIIVSDTSGGGEAVVSSFSVESVSSPLIKAEKIAKLNLGPATASIQKQAELSFSPTLAKLKDVSTASGKVGTASVFFPRVKAAQEVKLMETPKIKTKSLMIIEPQPTTKTKSIYFSEPKSENLQGVKQINLVSPISMNQMMQKVDLLSIQKQQLQQVQKLKMDQVQKLQMQQIQKMQMQQLQKMGMTQLQKMNMNQKLKTAPFFSRPSPRPTIQTPNKKIPPFWFEDFGRFKNKSLIRKKKSLSSLFVPFVKSKGKFRAVGGALPYFQAEQKAKAGAYETLGRSIRLISLSGQRAPISPDSAFRRSKRDPFTLVQRNPLVSYKEKKEIQQAKRNKKARFF